MSLLSFIANVTWSDLLDIVVVAYLIYRALLFFVDTRAMQLMRGIIVLALLGVVARALELDTLLWILGNLVGVFFTALIVVFQPELRQLLEELGRGRFLAPNAQVDEFAGARAKAMTEAVAYLAQHRIGALIVFQRDTGLREIWRSAVSIRSEITTELILSAFWPNNPLHDGAMIVDRQSIISAACYLPLTENTDISRWYGTRHRAAVGVTEVSDAQALVVSEETGHVSLAIQGRISRPLSETQLSRFITRYFTAQREERAQDTGILAGIRRSVAAFFGAGKKEAK